jgi:hypothetical protein
MFTADILIDTVQTGKKAWVNTFVTDDRIKDPMIKMIESQTELTKKFSKIGMDAFNAVSQEAVKAGQDAMKFDYNKMVDGILKTFQTTTKTVKA